MIGIPLILMVLLASKQGVPTVFPHNSEETVIMCDAVRILNSGRQRTNVMPLPETPKTAADFFAIKTNVASWAAGVMNVALEMQLGHSFSIELPIWWSPYFISHQHALRTFAIQPEFRYWLGPVGMGHFIGIHPGVAWYNLRWNDVRYQDVDLPLVNAGVSYGFSVKVNRHLNAEFTIGAGYARTKYNRFYNIENGAEIDTRQTTYWGIDRIGVSIVYHFDL